LLTGAYNPTILTEKDTIDIKTYAYAGMWLTPLLVNYLAPHLKNGYADLFNYAVNLIYKIIDTKKGIPIRYPLS